MTFEVESPFGVEAWVEYLSDKPLSVRNSIQRRLHKMLNSDRTMLSDLSRLLRYDPVLAFCIVRKASSMHTMKGSEVMGLDHAVNSLGMDNITEAMAEVPALKLNPTSAAQKMYFRAISDSHHAATQAHYIAHQRNLLFAEETYLASLFYGISHWCLWLHAPLHMSEIQIKIREQGVDSVIAENDILGCTTQELSKALVEHWGLSNLAAESLAHENSPDNTELRLLNIRAADDDRLTVEERRAINHLVQQKFFPVKISNWLALTAPLGWGNPKTMRIVEIFNDYMRGELDETAAQLHTNCATSARQYHVPGTLTPAAEMLFLPSKKVLHYKLSEREKRQLMVTAPPVRQPEEVKEDSANTEKSKSSGEATDILAGFADQKLYAATAQRLLKGHPTYTEAKHVIQALLQGLSRGLGMERVLFLRLDNSRQKVNLASAIGLPQDFDIRSVNYTLDAPTLFKRLSQKPSCIWISDNNRKEMMRTLPEQYHALIPPQGALLMSIFMDTKPVGIVQVDSPFNKTALQTFHHERFRYLCSAANLSLRKVATK